MESFFFAIGGNALSREGEEGNLQQQYAHSRETMSELARVLSAHPSRIIISHGNGPQVGNILFRSEYASTVLYPLTLDVCVSDSEGGMGYMLQQVLHNELARTNISCNVVTIITQVEVAPDDPALKNPTKFIGQFYTEEEAHSLARERGWTMRQDVHRGWRRVVASPRPTRIVEAEVVRSLLNAGIIVIAAGGGGIPVIRRPDGMLSGVEAVVDKDLASALLASTLGIQTLVIVTGEEKVCLDFTKPTRRALDRMTAADAVHYQAEGHFPPGSMGPKIEAAVNFIHAGGERVILTRPGRVYDAIEGRAGTTITG
ncbi:MAG: carbamate kinase [Candidatus Sumerlaeota bacterium]|nr:carbamate kinase [Candidatus Sumerlaeota bacterium]